MQDAANLQVHVKVVLEKFDGEKREGATPVEVIERDSVMSLSQWKEIQHVVDHRSS